MSAKTVAGQRHARPGWIAWGLLAVLVAVQLYGVYSSQAPGTPTFPHEDKLFHALLFGLPAAVACLARLRPRIVVGLLAVHAPVSELVQHYALPDRSGDGWDVVADLVGVGLAVGAAAVVGQVRSRW